MKRFLSLLTLWLSLCAALVTSQDSTDDSSADTWDQFEWTKGDGDKQTFFSIEFEASFNISYTNATTGEMVYTPEPIYLPGSDVGQNYTFDEDHCTTATIWLTWAADDNFPAEEWKFSLTYSVNDPEEDKDYCTTDDDFDYSLTAISLQYYMQDTYFPDAETGDLGVLMEISEEGLDYFKVDGETSYRCDSEQTYSISSNSSTAEQLMLTFRDYQSQFFEFSDDSDNAEYDTAKTCSADDDGSSLVPIIVGCVLAGLIVITLVAYFIGRWHQNKQGNYQAL